MYMQDERHSSSDPTSRHQQTTEPSYLQTHRKPLNKPKSQSTDSDNPYAKPSQTESSWLQEHKKRKEPSTCSCPSKRSKSADPPPVRSNVCACQPKPPPCGMHPQQAEKVGGMYTQTSITEPKATTTKTFKSSLTTCTKELLAPCTCGRKPPYWAGQSNLVSGPSKSMSKKSGTSKDVSNKTTRSHQSRAGVCPCRSKSLTNIQEATTGKDDCPGVMTWMSNLKSEPESVDCPHCSSGPRSDCPVCNEKQMESSNISVPSCRPITSRPPYNQPSFGVDYETSATSRSRSIVGKITCLCPSSEELLTKSPGTKPCSVSNQGNIDTTSKCTCGADFQDARGTSEGIYETSDKDPTSKCTCATNSQDPECTFEPGQGDNDVTFKCTCATDFQDAEGTSQGVCETSDKDANSKCTCATDVHEPKCPSHGTFEPVTSARIQHPSSFSQYIEADVSECDTRLQNEPSYASRVPTRVSMTQEEFCDCYSPSTQSCTCLPQRSDHILTSIHSHRSLSGGSCICKPSGSDDQSPYAPADSQPQKALTENANMFSCHTQFSGMKTPQDSCGSTCNACATRKQRVLRLVEELTVPSGCDCGQDRPCKIKQLFRELTLLLRSESESAVAPTDEDPCSEPLPFDECCTAQHERGGTEECKQHLSKKELQRVECFHQLEEYLRKTFMPPAEPTVPETDIYGFELNPDFSPDAIRECSSAMKNRSSVQFYDIGDGCSEDGVDINQPSCTCCKEEEVFQDCDCGNDDEENPEEKGEGEGGDCESDKLCDELKSFVEKELQDIEASAKGSVLDCKSPEDILKELCEGSTITVPSVKAVPCEIEEECKEPSVSPFAGMEDVSPWTDPNQDKPPYPYNLPIDPCVEKDPTEESSAGEPRGLLPPGPLPPDVRTLCEKLIRKALKDCGLCPNDCLIDTVCQDCEECIECPEEEIPEEECPEKCPEKCPEECPEKCQQGCLCCHCRALICDEECKTVSHTLRSAMCDPLCEMKYFIDSMIIDLHAMDCVLGTKQAKPKDIRANDASRNPCQSFPVRISNVTSLGCTSLFVQWEVADCRAIAGYEIYVDGHLTNRFYSFRHQAGVVTNVDVTNPHQIVLRAQAVGQEFPGQGSGKPNDGCECREVTPAHPEMAAGAERPWSPSFFFYDPNAPEGEIKC